MSKTVFKDWIHIWLDVLFDTDGIPERIYKLGRDM